MWSTSNVGHEPGVQTCHNISQEDTSPLLVQFLLARKMGKSCCFKATRFSISGVIASHSVGQCECERVCSIHNLACRVTLTVKTCHLWKETPPKKVRDMVSLQERALCGTSSRTENPLARAWAQWTGTSVFYPCIYGVVRQCVIILFFRVCLIFSFHIYIHTPSSNTTSTRDRPLLCDTSFVSLRAISSLTLCVDG